MAVDDHHVEAIAQATLSLVHGILKLLVKREMMTDSEVKELFLEAARQQRSIYDQHDVHSMANEQAANILEAIASKLADQSR